MQYKSLLKLLLCSEKDLGSSPCLREVCMFSLYVFGFSLGTLASSHIPKT